MEINLNLGSGKRNIEGYINIDVIKQTDETIVGDILSLKYKNNSVQKIFSEHVIEHLDKNEIQIFFSECYRMLKMGGELELIAPALDTIIDLFIKGKYDINQLDSYLYADHVHKFDYHKQGIYKEKLISLCTKYKFTILELKYQDRPHSLREIYLRTIK